MKMKKKILIEFDFIEKDNADNVDITIENINITWTIWMSWVIVEKVLEYILKEIKTNPTSS